MYDESATSSGGAPDLRTLHVVFQARVHAMDATRISGEWFLPIDIERLRDEPDVYVSSLAEQLLEERSEVLAVEDGLTQARAAEEAQAELEAQAAREQRRVWRKRVRLNSEPFPSRGTPVVYRYYDSNDRLLYVGYTSSPSVRDAAQAYTSWYAQADRITHEAYATTSEALDAEWLAINHESPLYNRTTRHGARAGL